MHRSFYLFAICLFPAGLFAQATVEGAVAAGNAAVTTAPSANIGKSINGLAGAIDGALKGAKGSDTQGPTQVNLRPTTTKGTKLAAPKPGAKLADPADIEAGMTKEEVLQRFGSPNLQLTDGPTISLLYSSKSGRVRVEIQDGKVASVEKPKS